MPKICSILIFALLIAACGDCSDDSQRRGVSENNSDCLDCELDAGGDDGTPPDYDDPLADGDSDGVPNGLDNCPRVANRNQADEDADGVGDACDNCGRVANADQLDADDNGTGDACQGDSSSYDPQGDDDNDTIPNAQDNCPAVANPDQRDRDNDGFGDACDNCPDANNPDQTDTAMDGTGDACRLAPIGPTCGNQEGDFDPIQPNIHILLDRSGSMAGQLWEDATTALDTIADVFHQDARFALSVFRHRDVTEQGAELLLEIGSHDPDTIKASYAQVLPGGATPTRQALDDIRTQPTKIGGLSNWISDSLDPLDRQRKKAVILITDGDPCCDPLNTIDSAELAAQRLCTNNIDTFVIGMPGASLPGLQRLAVAGCTDNQDPNDGINYYFSNDAAALTTALQTITGAVVTCDFQLRQTPEDPNKIWVAIGPTAIPRDIGHGFSYDATQNVITLNGNACRDLRAVQGEGLQITFGCASTCGEETCDFIDNDCDGVVDEGCEECGPEVCDGLDNDCDEEIDEGCPECKVIGLACSADADCCDGECDGGVCIKPCVQTGVACLTSSDCCSGPCSTNANGTGLCILQ